MDCDYCDPKWGVYGAEGIVMKNECALLKIGTTYESVRPDLPASLK